MYTLPDGSDKLGPLSVTFQTKRHPNRLSFTKKTKKTAGIINCITGVRLQNYGKPSLYRCHGVLGIPYFRDPRPQIYVDMGPPSPKLRRYWDPQPHIYGKCGDPCVVIRIPTKILWGPLWDLHQLSSSGDPMHQDSFNYLSSLVVVLYRGVLYYNIGVFQLL